MLVRKLIHLTSIILLGLGYVLANSAVQSDVSSLSSYTQFKAAYLLGMKEGLVAPLNNYLYEHPKDSDARLLLGQIYFEQSDYQKARKELWTVLQYTPNYADASVVLINVDIALGDYSEALTIADMSLLFNPIERNLLAKRADLLNIVAVNDKKNSSASQPSKAAVEEYKIIKALYSSGQHNEAKRRAIAYLNTYPTDGDVRLILAKFYFNIKEYKKAREESSIILQQSPHYIDARLMLINVEMSTQHYQKALNLTKVGLSLDPNNKSLRERQKKIISAIHDAQQGSAKGTSTLSAESPTEKIEYRNEIGLYQQQYYISDVKQIWDYSTLYYARTTTVGKIYGKLNYSNRLQRQALQGEVEAYPKLNKYVYLDLDIAFANEPNLFPDQTYGAEAYVAVGRAFNFSAGGKYFLIDERHNYTLYTGTLSKDFKSNRLTLRPFYFVPGVGEKSTLYTLDVRHIVNDPFYYVGCIFGAGTSPDLADLTTVNFIVVRNKLISPYINFPLYNERLIVGLNFLYQNQIFPRDRVRNWTGGTLSLAWKF